MEENKNKTEKDIVNNNKDLLNVSLIFAKALSLIFKDGQGIVVDITGDVDLGEDTKKVVVYSQNNQIHIYKSEEDIPEGTAVQLNTDDEEESE